MAQHDYNIANQSGADFRADLNNALSAIATVNSGATEPSTTFAHQLWVDTSSNVLKIRNAANNAWITTGVSITASNTFNGTLTGTFVGNATTATTLETARTINGVSFDGSANISFDTDSVSEGSSNLYFTNERVDDQVNTLLQAGTGIQLTYDDTAGTLTIANTNDADITGVVAGNGLTGGGTAGTVTLNVAVDDSSIEIDSDALQVKASGITNAMLAGSIANAKLSNSSVTINSNSLSLGGTLTLDTDDIGEGSTNLYYTDTRANSAFDTRLATKDTDNLSEGSSNLYYTDARSNSAFDTRLATKDTDDLSEGTSNLYYTDARSNSAFDTRLATKDTDDLSEGTSNLYYTQARFDSAFTAKSTSDLSEGTNLYYTDARFDTRLGTKDTGDLSEGTNLYYTDARARASISEDSTQLSYNSTTGVLSFTQGDTDTVNEGSSNLYYTSSRANADFDTRLATKSTTNLSEGTNLYYTTARFDSAFTGKDTDDLSEGSTNVYYTDARANSAIDARVTKSFVDALNVQAASVDANSVALGTDTTGNYVQTITGTANKISVSGSGSESADITLSLPDDVQIASDLTVAGNLTVNGTLTSLDTTNLDIEDNLFQLNSGLTGSPVNDSGMLINRGSSDNGIFMWDESADKFTLGLTTADGSATGNITLSSLGTLVANLEGAVTGNVTGTVSSISNHSTSDLSEGTNLYYTDARFDTRLGTKDTDDLSEGSSNLYYTTTRFNSAFSGKSTSDLSEGSNLYYTSARANSDFDTRLATKDTGDLAEGSNLYYTDARVQAVSINNVVEDTTPQLGGDLDLNSSDITGTGDINITGTVTASDLEVNNSSAGATVATFEGTYSASGDVKLASFKRNGGAVAAAITYADAATAMEFGTTTSHSLILTTGDTERMRISAAGGLEFQNQDFSNIGTIYATQYLANGDADTGIVMQGSNVMSMHTGNSERARFDALGNFGIGETSPDKILHLKSSGATGIAIESTTNAQNLDIDFYNNVGSVQGRIRYSEGAGSFGFAPNVSASDALTIDYSGDVQISGTIGTNSSTAFASMAGRLTFDTDYSDTQRGPNKIVLQEDGDWIAGLGVSNGATDFYTGGAFTFRTGTSLGSERMRITSSGSALFGVTAEPSGSIGGSGFIADSLGRMNLVLATTSTGNVDIANFRNPNGTVGSIRTNGSSTAYYTSSDYRLKENVDYTFNALDRVAQLKPARFNFIADEDTTVDGFLAHEVQDIVPEAIHGEKDAVKEEEYEINPAVLDDDGNVVTEAEMGTREVPDYQGIDQSKLVPLLTKAIQEQQELINNLTARIEQLEN